MFGLSRKDPWTTVSCKGRKVEGNGGKALSVTGLDFVEIVKKADASEFCTKIGFGRIYQKPGTLLSEHNPEDQGYHVRFDNLTKTIGVSLWQGLMRQTVIFATKDYAALLAELGLSLEASGPSELSIE